MKPSQCQQPCPECGATMKAGQPVFSCGQRARWWRCSNPKCGTTCLLSLETVNVRAILTQVAQLSLHGWLQNGP